MTARARRGSSTAAGGATTAWAAVRGAPCDPRSLRRFRRRILDPALPRRRMARSWSGPRRATSMRTAFCARSTVPAGAGSGAAGRRGRGARPQASAEALDYVGMLTLEFFADRRRRRSSTKWRRGSTIAAIGRSRARHLAVRESYPRDLRPAARRDRPGRRAGRDAKSDRRRGRRLGRHPRRPGPPTSISTARARPAPAARWAM